MEQLLRFREKERLEALFGMSSGYVLDFSDRTFAEFFRDFDVDIYSDQFSFGSGSKANRLRSFWNGAPVHSVVAVLSELIEHAEEKGASPEAVDSARRVVDGLNAICEGQSETGSTRDAPLVRSPPTSEPTRPVEIFFSYAHHDESLMDDVRRQLIVHERTGRILKWHDRKIPAGDEWRSEIDHRLEASKVILLFMSPHFIESQYCYEVEGQIALRRHREGSARVIPIILRPCDWQVTPFGELQALPNDAKPISLWADRDEACLDAARGVMSAIDQATQPR